MLPGSSIVIPTRGRPAYLEVALRSIAPQAAAAGAEVLVVDDAGPPHALRKLVEGRGARYVPHRSPLGLNAARNTGVEGSVGELIIFVDDDVEVRPGWLEALLAAAAANPEAMVFTGPIHPRLEGPAPRSCGREGPPITSLDLGAEDIPPGNPRGPRYAWGVNMALRRSALELAGPFDTSIEAGGDEQEWQERLALRGRPPADTAPRGPSLMYVAGAALDHRRAGLDARLRSLARTAQARGAAARRHDERSGEAPSTGRELAVLAGCAGHVVRRGCPAGLVMVAHSAGRLRELIELRRHPLPAGDRLEDFLSGASGTVGGLRGRARGGLDLAEDAYELASGRRARLTLAARRRPPRRRVLVLGVWRPEHAELTTRIRAELLRSRHQVNLRTRPPEVLGGPSLGKFQALNELLAARDPSDHRDSAGPRELREPRGLSASQNATGYDWLLVIDDDIVLPRGFLDRFLYLAEGFRLDLAQPAHRHRSHAAWGLTRRAWASAVRETRFVEIGPVTALGPRTWEGLLPFPDLRMGWGLDAHWAALAGEREWRLGIVDAVPIAHMRAPTAEAYPREEAIAEARSFLRERPYLSAGESQQTLARHRRL